MDVFGVVNLLKQKGGYIYYKFVATNCCDKCKVFEGKMFREDEAPKLPLHPNCNCELEPITDPVDLALAKYMPKEKYSHKDNKDFNEDRRQKEKNFGTIIDNSSFSAPGKELEENIKKKGLAAAICDNIAFREGKDGSHVYFDGHNLPTIGVGANLTQEHIIQKLLEMKVLSAVQTDALRRYGKLAEGDRTSDAQKQLKQTLSNINLTQAQIQALFQMTYKVAEKEVISRVSKGGWDRVVAADGRVVMVWNESKVDKTAWDKLPDLVKAICIDLSFNTGGKELERYQLFLKAIKAGDYRRAAIELLDSKDYKDNIGPNANNPGLAKRRRDAAIELSKLAGEQEANRKSSQ